MKKSHRKDVIIARIIFAFICIILVALIIGAANLVKDHFKNKYPEINTESTSTQPSESEDAQMSESEGGNTEPSVENSEGEDSENTENTENTEGVEPEVRKAVTTTGVNLRAEGNKDCEIITVVPEGSEVIIHSVEYDWAKVTYGDLEGYISMVYLKEITQTKDAAVEDATVEDTDTDVTKEETTNESESTEVAEEETSEEESEATDEVASSDKKIVVIDPGHQAKGDSKKEPNGPGSSVMKARVTGGTSGVSTGVPEYKLTLEVSKKLKKELEKRGYTVYMTRESHDVNISNKERAEFSSTVNADICIRIHANGEETGKVSGALMLTPSSKNPYVSNLADESAKLSKCVLDAYCKETGMKNKGVLTSDTMTGINWSTVPVTIIEMGFMSNKSEDENMQDDSFQEKMVEGMADGIDKYFAD